MGIGADGSRVDVGDERKGSRHGTDITAFRIIDLYREGVLASAVRGSQRRGEGKRPVAFFLPLQFFASLNPFNDDVSSRQFVGMEPQVVGRRLLEGDKSVAARGQPYKNGVSIYLKA